MLETDSLDICGQRASLDIIDSSDHCAASALMIPCFVQTAYPLPPHDVKRSCPLISGNNVHGHKRPRNRRSSAIKCRNSSKQASCADIKHVLHAAAVNQLVGCRPPLGTWLQSQDLQYTRSLQYKACKLTWIDRLASYTWTDASSRRQLLTRTCSMPSATKSYVMRSLLPV